MRSLAPLTGFCDSPSLHSMTHGCDLFFFLHDLVDLGRAVKQQRRLERENEQTDQAAEQCDRSAGD